MLLLAVVLLITGVMQGISIKVEEVNIEDVPDFALPWWQYIVLITTSVPWLILIGFGRNVFGYLRVFFRTNRKEEYDYNKLYETLTLYTGAILTIVGFTSMLPAPYDKWGAAIGSAIVVIIDLVRSEIGHLRETSKKR